MSTYDNRSDEFDCSFWWKAANSRGIKRTHEVLGTRQAYDGQAGGFQ